MEQTAVEWLKMQLEIRSGIKEITVDSKTFEELCKQAKEMFEKQIINASNESYLNIKLIKRSVENKKVLSVGEQYYNETFKNK